MFNILNKIKERRKLKKELEKSKINLLEVSIEKLNETLERGNI